MRALAATAFGLWLIAPVLAAVNADSPGKAPYDRTCGACHGREGRGEIGPPLVPLDKDFGEVLAIVREGIGEMPPVGPSTLSDEDVRLVVDYLKSIR
jgi:mono/diheme cytochrome c family protein